MHYNQNHERDHHPLNYVVVFCVFTSIICVRNSIPIVYNTQAVSTNALLNEYIVSKATIKEYIELDYNVDSLDVRPNSFITKYILLELGDGNKQTIANFNDQYIPVNSTVLVYTYPHRFFNNHIQLQDSYDTTFDATFWTIIDVAVLIFAISNRYCIVQIGKPHHVWVNTVSFLFAFQKQKHGSLTLHHLLPST
jgi:hypothetical protein